MAAPLPDPDSASAGTTALASADWPAAGLEGAPVTAPDTLAPQAESRTPRQYRAALGPVNTAHYLQVFDRFDAAGRRQLLWHPVAGLFTLGWLVFRRLWTEALAYSLLVAAGLGLCFWAWPVVESWPPGVRWGVLGSVLLLVVLLPGLLGYGLLHRQVQRRFLSAVSAARSMEEARATLARGAATQRRLWGVVAAHAVVVAALGLVGLVDVGEGGQRAAVVAESAAQAAAPAARLEGSAPSDSQAPLQTADIAQTAQPPADEAPNVRALPAEQTAPAPAAPKPAAAAPASASEFRADPAPQGPAPADLTAAYAINVGLFADEGNALRAEQRLLQAGLPVRVECIGTRNGPRTRVRVGPYPQREAADEAAQRIRALGLEPVVFRP